MTGFSFELAVNVLQILLLAAAVCRLWLAAWDTTEWAAVRIFSAGLFCYFVGDVYWTVHLLLRGTDPAVFSPADMAYFCTCIWLAKGAQLLTHQGEKRRPRWVWAMLALPIGSYVLWITWYGCEPFGSLLLCASLSLLTFRAASGLALCEKRRRPFFAALLSFLLLILLLQLSWGRVYPFIDLAVTASVAVMSVLLLKGVAKRDPC